jgi:hypothetical protein
LIKPCSTQLISPYRLYFNLTLQMGGLGVPLIAKSVDQKTNCFILSGDAIGPVNQTSPLST